MGMGKGHSVNGHEDHACIKVSYPMKTRRKKKAKALKFQRHENEPGQVNCFIGDPINASTNHFRKL